LTTLAAAAVLAVAGRGADVSPSTEQLRHMTEPTPGQSTLVIGAADRAVETTMGPISPTPVPERTPTPEDTPEAPKPQPRFQGTPIAPYSQR
jgi:hypothetical protein